MGFVVLRSIIRPLSRTLISRTPTSTSSTTPFFSSSSLLKPDFQLLSTRQSPWIPISNHFHSLTDTRFPKRRPVDKPRRKRASLRPPGPYAWVQYTPGQPISPNNPNQGSVKRRNEKKRMRQRRAFILIFHVSGIYLCQGERVFEISSKSGVVVLVTGENFASEAKKRKAQLQEANRKKRAQRVERKMAAVARERAWAERLAELQRLEEEKKISMS
ncbi:hypothetical protein CUMW_237360 [Citrus unshiu]|uniref:Uncharacterized protein n=1 Tax=Citrus unshiu TaxID=55188 RepID=A0A2H5QL03_CITUN|nr:hypothetical protein CUMW_237360 [Citrus unshiu]